MLNPQSSQSMLSRFTQPLQSGHELGSRLGTRHSYHLLRRARARVTCRNWQDAASIFTQPPSPAAGRRVSEH
jgi:hypothetical protein